MDTTLTTMALNAVLAFVEGFALIVSPCILPILPIMLSSSIEGGKRRPIGIILGFVLSFAMFTFFARSLVQGFGLNLDWVRLAAFGLIILFGIILISDTLSGIFSRLTARLGNWGEKLTQTSTELKGNTGFLSGLLLGILISFVWVPCAGPILAAAIVQTAIQKSNWQTFIIFLSFALGSAIPMMCIAWFGRGILSKTSYLKSHSEVLRKIFGLIIIVGALIAAWMSLGTTSNISATPLSIKQMPALGDQLVDALIPSYPAPSLQPNGAWLNSQPLKIEQLKGKVVLIDFWTYSCINCIRTLPHLLDWYSRYHPYGFEIIGVHTPEFEFEKNLDNVKEAIARDHIPYPVLLDNEYVTWLNYHNQYWPAHYLIDKEGRVVYKHFGEGSYEETEHNIRVLLGLDDNTALGESKSEKTTKPMLSQTPETYLGAARARTFSSPEMVANDKMQHYSIPTQLPLDHWALEGYWQVDMDKIIAGQLNTRIVLHFAAAKLYAVLGTPNNKPIIVKTIIKDKNGNPLSKASIEVTEHRLYELVHLSDQMDGFLELIPETPGLEIYTFTFGD